ncbi:hypothetical protein CVS40_5919 [Lucilia cuprina]|nr:hypothetical protein CVS40_5919 [Lucilia cuprina]
MNIFIAVSLMNVILEVLDNVASLDPKVIEKLAG